MSKAPTPLATSKPSSVHGVSGARLAPRRDCRQSHFALGSAPSCFDGVSNAAAIFAPGPLTTLRTYLEAWGIRCQANVGHIRQSRSDAGLDFQVKVLET